MNKNGLELLPLLLPDFKPPRGARGENLICLDIAMFLREQSLTNEKFPYVWFHVPNQFAGTYKGVFGAMLSWMGRIAGVPDYVFMGKGQCFFIEVKTASGSQSEHQKLFQKWCESKEVPYYVCRSLDDVRNVLNESKKNAESLKLPSI